MNQHCISIILKIEIRPPIRLFAEHASTSGMECVTWLFGWSLKAGTCAKKAFTAGLIARHNGRAELHYDLT